MGSDDSFESRWTHVSRRVGWCRIVEGSCVTSTKVLRHRLHRQARQQIVTRNHPASVVRHSNELCAGAHILWKTHH